MSINVSVQVQFLRNSDGVVPVILRNTSVKWLWLEKPRASAMSVIDARSDSSISIAFRNGGFRVKRTFSSAMAAILIAARGPSTPSVNAAFSGLEAQRMPELSVFSDRVSGALTVSVSFARLSLPSVVSAEAAN